MRRAVAQDTVCVLAETRGSFRVSQLELWKLLQVTNQRGGFSAFVVVRFSRRRELHQILTVVQPRSVYIRYAFKLFLRVIL